MVTVVGPAAEKASAKAKEPSKPAHLLLAIPAARAKAAGTGGKPALTAKEALIARTKAKQAAASKGKASDAGARPTGDAQGPIDPEILTVGWDRAAEVLRGAGEGGPALVDAWLRAPNVEAIAAAAEAEDLSGSVRKAARRALHVLKSRGVAIPARPRVARIAEERIETVEATLIPPDSSGTSSIAVTSRDASGRYRIAEVIVRESVGVLHAGSGWLSGSQLKEGRARALGSLGTAPVSIPVAWARYRIAEASRQNATSGHVMPLGIEGCRELIDPAPDAEPSHPVADLEEALTPESVAAHAATSQALHEEPEFRSWLPTRQALDELLQKVGQRLTADTARDQGRVSAALSEEIELATDRFFSPEVREVMAARMRDSAISLRARRGDELATKALAVARAVKEAGLITSPPREIQFLTAFFQKGIALLAQQGGGQLRIPVAAGDAGAGDAEDTDAGVVEEAGTTGEAIEEASDGEAESAGGEADASS